jgi:hypothetical protein
MMQTAGSLFERYLAKLIKERRDKLVNDLSIGMSVKSMEDYRDLTGRISELEVVEGLCEEAQSQVNKTL